MSHITSRSAITVFATFEERKKGEIMATKYQLCAKGPKVLLFGVFRSKMLITLTGPAVAWEK